MRSHPLQRRRATRHWRTPLLLLLVVTTFATFAVFGSGVSGSQAAPLQLPIEAPWSEAARADGDAATARLVGAASGDERSDADATAEESTTDVFATVEDLELHSPSTDAKVHGFHEAGSRESLTMTPVGDDTTVLPSRGRGSAATSAVDIVLVDDDPVVSPVDGTVTDHATYRLYGRTQDRRLVIRPDDAPHLRVVVLHIGGMRVEVGDQVVAGETVVAARARKLPFGSQVDKETAPDAWPHVHLEVVDRG